MKECYLPVHLAIAILALSALLECTCGQASVRPSTQDGSGGGIGGSHVSRDPQGWTVVTPSSDSRVIYVSSLKGDDANDGLSEGAPKKTSAAGTALLRQGYPDQLLFKRGDVWQEANALDVWQLSGRSPQEPMVIGAYGTGNRPRFDFSNGPALMTFGGGDSPISMDNLIFMSLHFLGTAHDPTHGTPSGAAPLCVRWLQGGQDDLFEDMRFEFCELVFQDTTTAPISRLTIRRSLLLDSYDLSGAHAQGIYIENTASTTIQENIFDHCGWYPNDVVPGASPTMFNHCVYWQTGQAGDGILTDNIIMRASAHGTQMRSSGQVKGNVYAQVPMAGFLAGDFLPTPSGSQGTFVGNLVAEGVDMLPRQGYPDDPNGRRGWGWDLIDDINDAPGHTLTNVTMSDNILTHCLGTQCQSQPASWPNSTLSANIVWSWPAGKQGYQDATSGPFPDPERTFASYNASLGGVATFDAFAIEVRKQSKTNWRTQYTAPAIIAYFRKGFGL
jgi:hypothetical protein